MTNNQFELTPEEEDVLDAIDDEEASGIKKMDPAKAIEMLEKRRAYLRAELHTALNSFEECAPEIRHVIGVEIGNLSEDIEDTIRRIYEYKVMLEGKN